MGTDRKSIQEVVNDFEEAYESRDMKRILEFFADDGEWFLTGLGSFKGKETLRQFLYWDAGAALTMSLRPIGIGILIKDNIAVRESMCGETWEGGLRVEFPTITVFEFDDEQKIRRMASYYDRLSMTQQGVNQMTGVKGWLPKRLVNFLVAQASKGVPRAA